MDTLPIELIYGIFGNVDEILPLSKNLMTIQIVNKLSTPLKINKKCNYFYNYFRYICDEDFKLDINRYSEEELYKIFELFCRINRYFKFVEDLGHHISLYDPMYVERKIIKYHNFVYAIGCNDGNYIWSNIKYFNYEYYKNIKWYLFYNINPLHIINYNELLYKFIRSCVYNYMNDRIIYLYNYFLENKLIDMMIMLKKEAPYLVDHFNFLDKINNDIEFDYYRLSMVFDDNLNLENIENLEDYNIDFIIKCMICKFEYVSDLYDDFSYKYNIYGLNPYYIDLFKCERSLKLWKIYRRILEFYDPNIKNYVIKKSFNFLISKQFFNSEKLKTLTIMKMHEFGLSHYFKYKSKTQFKLIID